MELQPSEPPGNAKRKLRGYVHEIARLRAEGYTLRAIHQALIDAGVVVAWSTVQRESARLGKAQQAAKSEHVARPASATKDAVSGQTIAPDTAKKAGAEEVESFFAHHNANPLFNKKAKKP